MTSERLSFDGFELRPDSGELLRNGAVVRLQPQPFKILSILASRAGELVERDEIRRLVWGDAHLDVDASLNFCVKQIRQALGDSATSPRYVETLPRRGYRFLQPVSFPQPPSNPPQKARSNQWAAIFTVAILSTVLFVLVGSRHVGLVKPRLAVLPFECRSTPELCGGINQVLTFELVRRFPSEVEVIAPTSAEAFAGKSPEEIASGLRATHLLTGTAIVAGQELRLAARLVSIGGNQVLWQDEVATGLGDAPLLYAQLVREIARGLRLPPPPMSSPRAVAPPSPAAYEAFLEGRYLLSQDLAAAMTRLQDAVLLAPRFAEAHAALALALLEVEKPLCPERDQIEAAARRALALDPNLAEAHLALARSLFHCRRDWLGARQEYRKALALDPGNAVIYHHYSLFLTALGDHGAAIAAARRAMALDPVSMLVSSDLAYMLYAARRYDESIRQARRTLSLIEQAPKTAAPMQFFRIWTLWTLFHAARQAGDEETALAAGLGIRDLQAGSVNLPPVRTLDELLRRQKARTAKPSPRKPGSLYFDATTAAGVGNSEQALLLLEEDCRTRKSYMLHFVGVEPGLDSLHGDPRFSRILDCIRLPADAPARQRLNRRPAAGPTTPDPGSGASASDGTSGPAPPYPPG